MAVEARLTEAECLKTAAVLSLSGQRGEPGFRNRVARISVAAWLIGRHLEHITTDAPLVAGLEWLTDGEPGPRSIHALQAPTLRGVKLHRSFREMLPYVLDVHGEGTRRSVLKNQDNEVHRRSRKGDGVFFTPGDVAHFMTLQVIDAGATRCPSVIDPACGTGVFLRSAYRTLVEQGHPPDLVLTHLHGIDLSPATVDGAALVLLLERLATSSTESVLETWKSVLECLLVADTLQLLSEPGRKSWPGSWPTRFDAIVANPPYARLGDRADLDALRLTFKSLKRATSATNTYLPFLEMTWLLASKDAKACMVVPMSIAFSTVASVAETRQAMQEAGGRWTFSFYDRTPDALFGDDVKQRNSIVLREASRGTEVVTGPITRWTSRTRGRLFETLRAVSLGTMDVTNGIPRLASDNEAHALRRIEAHAPRLSDFATSKRVYPADCDAVESSVFVAGTAYNWLSAYRDTNWFCTLTSPTTSPLTAVQCGTDERADFVYALLASKLAYWLWRVRGDGFHVSTSLVLGLPVPESEACRSSLALLGSELWTTAQLHPVTSINRGRCTITYSPWTQWALVEQIDRLLLESLGLPATFHSELTELVRSNVIVDPTDESRTAGRQVEATWITA